MIIGYIHSNLVKDPEPFYDASDFSRVRSGTYQASMSFLRALGLVPLNVAHIMRERVEYRGKRSNPLFSLDSSGWKDGYNTADGIAVFGDRLKVVPDSNKLREITPNTPHYHSTLPLSVDEFNALEGLEFSRSALKESGHFDYQTRKAGIENPIMRILARENKHLLVEHTKMAHAHYIKPASLDPVEGRWPKIVHFDPRASNMEMYHDRNNPRPWLAPLFILPLHCGTKVEVIRMGGSFWDIVGRPLVESANLEEDYFRPPPPIQNDSHPLDDRVIAALNEGKSFKFKDTVFVPVAADSQLKKVS